MAAGIDTIQAQSAPATRECPGAWPTRTERADMRNGIEIALANGGVTIIDVEDRRHAAFAWRQNPGGYVERKIGPAKARRCLLLHRIILGVADPRIEVDHRDLDRLNNRRRNLRETSHAQNGQNLPLKDGTSRFRGVTWETRRARWVAASRLDGRNYYLGTFQDELDAGRSAEAFRRAHMPFATMDMTLDPVGNCRCTSCRDGRAIAAIASGADLRQLDPIAALRLVEGESA
jgi:hypothetical protein